MSSPRSRSRSGCSATRRSSSATSSPPPPSSRSASIRVSRASSRSSSSRRVSPNANVSKARSASGGPRQSASASRSVLDRCSAPWFRRLRDQSLEAAQIELIRVDLEHIAGRFPHQRLSADQSAQLSHDVLERSPDRLRRLLAPHLVDDAVGRHDRADVEQQEREHCPLPLSAEGERPRLVHHLDWTEDPELEHLPVLALGYSADQAPLAIMGQPTRTSIRRLLG